MRKWFIVLSSLLCLVDMMADEGPILQATIGLTPTYATPASTKNMQPAVPVFLQANIKNVGDQPNAEGEVLIRFSLPKQLANLGKREMFTTERVPLPALMPGQESTISFKTPQQLPDMADFLRNDWPMYRYETIAIFGQQEFVLGTDTITFSAHYYLGPNKPLPTRVPSP